MSDPKILVIDDSLTARMKIKALLEGEGDTVLLASNGQEGTALAVEHRPDVIILDVVLPDTDGIELCASWQAQQTLKDTPVLLISGERSGRNDRTAGLHAGALGYITKPFANPELLAQVGMLVRLNATHRKLRESEAMARVLLNAPSEQSVLIDREGTVLACNDAVAQSLHMSCENMIGRCVFDLLPAELADRRRAHVVRVRDSGRPARFEDQWDGRVLDNSVVPVMGGNGEIMAFAIFAHDITDRKRMEEEQRASNTELRRLNERLDSAAIRLKEIMKSVVASDATAERFVSDDLVPCWEVKGCSSLTCPAHGCVDNLRCWEIASTHCRMEHGKTGGRAAKNCEGCEVFQHAREDSISDLGETFNDMITTLEDRQRALEGARRAAEAAAAAKSEFLANMSHEIRTPMTAMLGYIDQIADSCARQCNFGRDELPEQLDTISRNADLLLRIINDILDLSKIEAGKMTVESIPCKPHEIIAEVVSLMRTQADDKGLTFDLEYAGAVPETVRTDPTRLRQILINLIGNAIKFTDAGSVQLVVSLVRDLGDSPDGTPEASHLQFDVVDTGQGMTEEQVEKLFQPFTQADNSATRRSGGTGLGLAISKRFAGMLGGDINIIEAGEGTGARFRATIATGSLEGVAMLDNPQTAGVAASDSGQTAEDMDQQGLHGIKILLAEDGLDNQRLIALILRKAGATVTVVENGELAAQMALAALNRRLHSDPEHPYDIILMDMQMPVMDGYEATRLLRQRGYTGPVIALTAHAMEGDREKCLNAGCDDYASKPIDRKKLIETIRAHAQPVVAHTSA